MAAVIAYSLRTASDMDPRERIKSRMEELDKSTYWLAEKLRGQLSQNAIYSYLRGETDMKGENLGKICAVLGLDLYPSKKK